MQRKPEDGSASVFHTDCDPRRGLPLPAMIAPLLRTERVLLPPISGMTLLIPTVQRYPVSEK
jgi:hypothetical protein